MNKQELYWAGGFFCGEGHTRCQPDNRNHNHRYLIISINNTHLPNLQRFQEAVGLGKITGPMPRPPYKDNYTYAATNFEHVQAIIAMIWEGLSPEKKDQAIKAFKFYYERTVRLQRKVMQHGTGSMYVGGCRCDSCKQEHRRLGRMHYYERKAEKESPWSLP